MVKCRECGFENLEDMDFCSNCGKPFSAISPYNALTDSMESMHADNSDLREIIGHLRMDIRSMRKSMIKMQFDLRGIFWIMLISFLFAIGICLFTVIIVLNSGLL